jgi:hypothetical protein
VCQEAFYKPHCPGVSKPESFQSSTNILLISTKKNKNKQKNIAKNASSTLIDDQHNSIDNLNANNSAKTLNSIDISDINSSDILIPPQLLAHEYALVNPNGSNTLSEMAPVTFDSNDIIHLATPNFYDCDSLLIKPNEISGIKRLKA